MSSKISQNTMKVLSSEGKNKLPAAKSSSPAGSEKESTPQSTFGFDHLKGSDKKITKKSTPGELPAAESSSPAGSKKRSPPQSTFGYDPLEGSAKKSTKKSTQGKNKLPAAESSPPAGSKKKSPPQSTFGYDPLKGSDKKITKKSTQGKTNSSEKITEGSEKEVLDCTQKSSVTSQPPKDTSQVSTVPQGNNAQTSSSGKTKKR